MRLLYFGWLRDTMGTAAIDLPSDMRFGTVADLRAWIGRQSTDAGKRLALPGVRVAVDQEFATDSTSLVGVKEVAFMPPLSGG